MGADEKDSAADAEDAPRGKKVNGTRGQDDESASDDQADRNDKDNRDGRDGKPDGLRFVVVRNLPEEARGYTWFMKCGAEVDVNKATFFGLKTGQPRWAICEARDVEEAADMAKALDGFSNDNFDALWRYFEQHCNVYVKKHRAVHALCESDFDSAMHGWVWTGP